MSVERLLDAAEMADYLATRQRHSRDVAAKAGDSVVAGAHDHAAAVLEGLALALRRRARDDEDTGVYVIAEGDGAALWIPRPLSWWRRILRIGT